MKDLVCDSCYKDIEEGEEYIETDMGDVYCSDQCLLNELEISGKIEYKVNK